MNIYVIVNNGEEDVILINRTVHRELAGILNESCLPSYQKKYILQNGIVLPKLSKFSLKCVCEDAYMIIGTERLFPIFSSQKWRNSKKFSNQRQDLRVGDTVEISSNCAIYIW